KMPSENLARSLTSSSFSRKVFEGTKLMANLSGQLIVGQLCTRAPVLYHESEHHAATRQGAQMTTIFDRLAAGRPAPPIEKPKRQPKELAEALLGWLERWPKNIVSSRDIRSRIVRRTSSAAPFWSAAPCACNRSCRSRRGSFGPTLLPAG